MTRTLLTIPVLIAMLSPISIPSFPVARADDSTNDASAKELLELASQAAESGDSAKAVELATAATRKQPDLAGAWYLRGREHFRLARFDESLADFDRFVELRADLASRQWERGITCYYAGKFEQGAKQFELYQSFHDNDVENSVWRYLCMARAEGVEKARDAMLPIKNDPRVPMMQVYELYRGRATPDDVLTAANAGEPSATELNQRLFYAHLYLGLFYEAAGDKERAKTHIIEAADKHKIGHYMWDVARVHADRLREEGEKGE